MPPQGQFTFESRRERETYRSSAQQLPSRGATFYRGIPRGTTTPSTTTAAAAAVVSHRASSPSSLEAQLRQLDEELQSHGAHGENNSLQVRAGWLVGLVGIMFCLTAI